MFFIHQWPEICLYYTQTQKSEKKNNMKLVLDCNQQPIKYGIAYGKLSLNF